MGVIFTIFVSRVFYENLLEIKVTHERQIYGAVKYVLSELHVAKFQKIFEDSYDPKFNMSSGNTTEADCNTYCKKESEKGFWATQLDTTLIGVKEMFKARLTIQVK